MVKPYSEDLRAPKPNGNDEKGPSVEGPFSYPLGVRKRLTEKMHLSWSLRSIPRLAHNPELRYRRCRDLPSASEDPSWPCSSQKRRPEPSKLSRWR
jgi:hypothetical protein